MKILFVLLIATFSLNATAHEPKVVPAGEAEVTPFPGHDTYLLSDHTGTPSGAAVLEIKLPAKTFGAPPHVHAREDEHFYVIEGHVEFLDREKTVTAGPGSLVVLPRGHLHGFWNLSDKPARMLLVVTPGEFASFFDEVVATIRQEHPDNPQAVGAIIAQVAATHDVTVHPDKIPASALSVMPQ